MRFAALILALACVAGCKSNPPLPEPPKVVKVVVKEIVPVPEEMTQPCDPVAKKGNTYGEAVRLANARLVALQECNKRMDLIRGLGRGK